MKRLLLILTVASSLFVANIRGQDAESLLKHAVQLMNSNEYDAAIEELRRLVYFNDSAYIDAYTLLGDCYVQIDNFSKAIYFYRIALKSYPSDSLQTEAKFRIINANLKAYRPEYARMSLFGLPDSLNSYFNQKRAFYSFVIYYQLKDYEQSKDFFYSALELSENERVENYFKLAAKNADFNVNIPLILSVIPGLGQLSIGEYEAALNSLFLNGAVTTLYVTSLQSLSYLDAFLMVLPWLHRYYQGGMLNAKRLAELKKERKDSELFNSLLDAYIVEMDSLTTPR